MQELKRKSDNDNFWLTISSQIVRSQKNITEDEEIVQAPARETLLAGFDDFEVIVANNAEQQPKEGEGNKMFLIDVEDDEIVKNVDNRPEQNPEKSSIVAEKRIEKKIECPVDSKSDDDGQSLLGQEIQQTKCMDKSDSNSEGEAEEELEEGDDYDKYLDDIENEL